MTDEIREVIEKHLPAQVGDVLQQRLEEAEQTEKDLELMTGIANRREQEIVKLKDEIQELEERLQWAGNLDEREKSVTKREQEILVHELQNRLDAQERIADAHQSFLKTLVGNNVVKRRIHGNRPQQAPTTVGQYGTEYPSTHEDITEEEEG